MYMVVVFMHYKYFWVVTSFNGEELHSAKFHPINQGGLNALSRTYRFVKELCVTQHLMLDCNFEKILKKNISYILITFQILS